MTSEIRWVSAVEREKLWEGDILDVEVDDEQVLLVHLTGGDVKAYQGMCPHQEVLLADGKWDEDSAVLLCGGHNWEFDMKTGAGLNPTGCRLYEYPVRVTEDRIQVGIPQDGRRHHNRFQP
ncbi:Rieske 2Fe-2S domain-containing protein [Streptomyces sp. NPDC005202]|uniref:Rieske 2Fe-2S domain-containing protein n=1 Tax=Streptomyces sp. NPDC005202 TaxID=3157021 RepID=UPI0033BBAA75